MYNKKYDEALDWFDAAIEDEESSESRAYIGRGTTLMQLQDYKMASSNFANYLAEYPANYQVYRFLGDAQRKPEQTQCGL